MGDLRWIRLPVVWLSAPRTDAGIFDEYCSKGELAAVDDNWKPADIIDRCRELEFPIKDRNTRQNFFLARSPIAQQGEIIRW